MIKLKCSLVGGQVIGLMVGLAAKAVGIQVMAVPPLEPAIAAPHIAQQAIDLRRSRIAIRSPYKLEHAVLQR